MSNYKQVSQLFQKIRVIRGPKHRLSTFGTSRIAYQLVTDIPGLADRSRLRRGEVTAQKPAIITAQALKEQFLGFGSEAQDYANWLVSHYGEALRGLEYQFKNELSSMTVELVPPDALVKELTKEFDQEGGADKTLIRGTDRLWELSIMKFIVEETLSSFSNNVKELYERGFFEGDSRLRNIREREIRHLFRKAKTDRETIPHLGKKLKEYGLFQQYQDAFFQLLDQ